MANKISFEQLVKQALEMGKEVRVVPTMCQSGHAHFYAHVLGGNSDTVDMQAAGNLLRPLKYGALSFENEVEEDDTGQQPS